MIRPWVAANRPVLNYSSGPCVPRWDIRTTLVVATVFVLFICINVSRAAEGTMPIRIPFTLNYNLPTVSALVNNHPVLLFIDSGMYKPVALTSSALEELPVRFMDRIEQFRDFQGQTHTHRQFTVDTLSIGTLDLPNLEGIEFDMLGSSGAIGLPVLSKYVVVLDYRRLEMLLYPTETRLKTLKNQCGRPFPIQLASGVVVSKVNTEHGEFTFDWDTGASETTIRPSSLGLGFFTFVTSERFQRFNLGGKKLGPTRVQVQHFSAPDVDGILGTDFFANRVLCLDVGNLEASLN
jgi:hypothetical protein